MVANLIWNSLNNAVDVAVLHIAVIVWIFEKGPATSHIYVILYKNDLLMLSNIRVNLHEQWYNNEEVAILQYIG